MPSSLRQSSANNRSNDVRLSVLRNMLRAVIVMLIAPCGHNAWSQAPRAIKIVVPYPPAGTADIVARLLADQIGRAQGLTGGRKSSGGGNDDWNRSRIASGARRKHSPDEFA